MLEVIINIWYLHNSSDHTFTGLWRTVLLPSDVFIVDSWGETRTSNLWIRSYEITYVLYRHYYDSKWMFFCGNVLKALQCWSWGLCSDLLDMSVFFLFFFGESSIMCARCGSKSLHPIQKKLPSQHAVQIIVLSDRKQHSTKKLDITFDPCVTVELE